MTKTLHLLVATPDRVLVDADGVVSVRAEDESGSFGVLPGHVDLLTVLAPSVLRWRLADGTIRHCAIHGGVLTVTGGNRVAVASRRGEVGDDLAGLEAKIRRREFEESDAARRVRVDTLRLHALAVRRLVRVGAGDGVVSTEAPSEPPPDLDGGTES